MTDQSSHYLQAELEALVQSSPEIFHFLQAGSLDGIWYWDLEAPEHEWMSARFWEILGRDPALREHKAAEWQDLIHPDDLVTATANFHRHLADPDHAYDQVVRYRHPDGSTVWVRCRGIAIRDAEGRPTRMLGAHNDITALKRSEARLSEQLAALAKAQEQARQRDRDLAEFATIASHDLQAPLRAIASFLQLIQQDLGPNMSPQHVRWFEIVVNAVHEEKVLIDALLSYSRVQSHLPAWEEVDLDAVVERALTQLADPIQESAALVRTAPLDRVWGDAEMLTLAVRHLIDNALKFRGAGPPVIDIRSETVGGQIAFHVSDDGIGIQEADHATIFKAFRRLHRKSEYPGSGIGLAVVSRIADSLGGWVQVDSTPGAGSRFTLMLPGAPS